MLWFRLRKRKSARLEERVLDASADARGAAQEALCPASRFASNSACAFTARLRVRVRNVA